MGRVSDGSPGYLLCVERKRAPRKVIHRFMGPSKWPGWSVSGWERARLENHRASVERTCEWISGSEQEALVNVHQGVSAAGEALANQGTGRATQQTSASFYPQPHQSFHSWLMNRTGIDVGYA